MPQPLSFRWDEDFVAQIDKARGKAKRSTWVREACERALAATQGEPDSQPGARCRAKPPRSESGRPSVPAPPRASAARPSTSERAAAAARAEFEAARLAKQAKLNKAKGL